MKAQDYVAGTWGPTDADHLRVRRGGVWGWATSADAWHRGHTAWFLRAFDEAAAARDLEALAGPDEAAWTEEAESRLAAFRRGEVSAVDGPTVLQELRSRYRP